MPHIAQSQNSPEVQIASEGVQLATEVELHEGFDELPTATPVHEELEEAQEIFTGRVQCVESSQSSIQRRRVGGEPTIAQSQGWNIFCSFFFMGGIAIATASITLVNAWGNSPFIQLPTSQPTPFNAIFPTAFPNSVYTPTKDPTSCTTVFSAAGENMRISQCTEAGCDGSILWCDLIDEINYRLVVSVRGHYGGKKKQNNTRNEWCRNCILPCSSM